MAQPRRITSDSKILAHPRIISRHRVQRTAGEELKEVPWTTIVLLLLVLILILALWGKLPSRWRLPHQGPAGNAPGVSSLVIKSGLPT